MLLSVVVGNCAVHLLTVFIEKVLIEGVWAAEPKTEGTFHPSRALDHPLGDPKLG